MMPRDKTARLGDDDDDDSRRSRRRRLSNARVRLYSAVFHTPRFTHTCIDTYVDEGNEGMAACSMLSPLALVCTVRRACNSVGVIYVHMHARTYTYIYMYICVNVCKAFSTSRTYTCLSLSLDEGREDGSTYIGYGQRLGTI